MGWWGRAAQRNKGEHTQSDDAMRTRLPHDANGRLFYYIFYHYYYISVYFIIEYLNKWAYDGRRLLVEQVKMRERERKVRMQNNVSILEQVHIGVCLYIF